MESKNKKLGYYIHQVSEKNTNLLYDNVLGVAIEKEFMPSVANLIGTDLTKYNVVRKNRFAFNPMHVGRDEKLPIAKYKDETPALVSPAYMMFELNNEDELLSDYLELIMKTPHFDHACWYHTDASVRGGLGWDDFSNLIIPVPPIEEQRKIVHDYKVITDRIELLKKINENLEEQAETYYLQKFVKSGESIGWQKHLLKEYIPVITGKKDANVAVENGKYQFFSCSIDVMWTDEYSFNDEAILVAGNGDFSVKWYSGKFEAYQRTYVLIPENRTLRDLLYYSIKYALPFATSAARGSVISFITKGILEEISFYMPLDDSELKKECEIFKSFNNLIDCNKKELLSLEKSKKLLLSNLTKEV